MSTPPRDPRTRRRLAHPPHVYRRRRLVVLVVLCLVVVAAIKLWPDGGQSTPTSARVTTPPSAAASGASPEPERHAEPQSGVVRVHLRAPKATCNPRKITVEPSVAPHTRAGGTVPIRLAISTSAKRACTLDLSADSLLLEVSDDDDALWDSAACQEVSVQSVTLQPTWASVATTSWSGRTATKSCDGDGDPVPPGKYTVKAAVLGGEPGESTFTLSQQPAPKHDDKGDRAGGSKKSDSTQAEGSQSR